MSAPNNAPHTSVQYRSPATARPTMLIASTTAWPRSMSASCLKRKSRCSSANGTVLNDVMTKVALMATTTRGSRDDGREQAHAPYEHGQAVELAQLLATQLTDGEDRSAQPEFGEQRHQAEIDRRHAHETVVLGGEQPGDDQPGDPVEPLAPPPGCRGPRDAAQQGAIEGSRLAGRRRPCQVGKRR